MRPVQSTRWWAQPTPAWAAVAAILAPWITVGFVALRTPSRDATPPHVTIVRPEPAPAAPPPIVHVSTERCGCADSTEGDDLQGANR